METTPCLAEKKNRMVKKREGCERREKVAKEERRL